VHILWPPEPLGLGTPLNLASSSAATRSLFRRSWWLILVLGLAIPLLMLTIDQLFFQGVSLERVRDLGSQPLLFRLLVVVYSGVTEEILYRLILATSVGWLSFVSLSRITKDPKTQSQWLGVLVSALLFGLAHVGNLPDVPNPVLRALALNGIAGLVLGWLYWWRGLEMAMLTHMVAIVVLYVAVPPFI